VKLYIYILSTSVRWNNLTTTCTTWYNFQKTHIPR